MSLFNKYPWSNFHRLNADWLLETVTDLAERAEAALANVGEWAARIAHAEEKADQAAADAASAVARAAQAQIDADSAAASAAQAAQDAQDAETSAGHSAQSASAAVDLADQAAASASAALTQAANAATSASAAQTQAANAATSASAAQTQAANAATSAAQAAASAAQAAQAATPSVSNYNITFAYPVTGGQDITLPDFRDVLADIEDGKEIVFNLTFEGNGQGVIDGTARVTGVFADVSQTHIWVYLRVENTLYAVSWFHQGYGTTVYSVYDQTEHNVPPVGNANNGKVLTSHGSYYSWSDIPGPLFLEFATTNPYTVTTPIADILAAIKAGRQVYFKGTYTVGNNATAYIPLSAYGTSGTSGRLTYAFFGGDSAVQAVIYDETEGWSTYAPPL